MRRTTARRILFGLIVLIVVLVPACNLRGGRLVLEGPTVSPEVAAAIQVAGTML